MSSFNNLEVRIINIFYKKSNNPLLYLRQIFLIIFNFVFSKYFVQLTKTCMYFQLNFMNRANRRKIFTKFLSQL